MIVGIAGYAGSGKDTAAAALTALGFRQDSLAAPLKAMALDINPWIRIPGTKGTSGDYMDHLFVTLQSLFNVCGHDWEKVKKYDEARRFLQNLGQSARDHVDVNIWLDALLDRFNAEWEGLERDLPGEYCPEPDVVVSDVRYPNEGEPEKRPEGTAYDALVWVTRPGVGPVNEHASDQGLVRPYCTHEVVNNGTIEELHEKIRKVVGL
jgi:hypothetical protein